MHFVFWQNLISPHQAPFLRELAVMGDDVTVVAPEEMEEERRALGWQLPDLGPAKVLIGPTDSDVVSIVANSADNSIHIMAGARWLPLGELATSECLKQQRRIGVLTEAPDPRGISGIARRLKYVAEYWRRGRHYDFMLAMGEMGMKWFHGCGYEKEILFPFCYVTEVPPNIAPPVSEPCVTILFVGRLVSLKGMEVLLQAFAPLPASLARLVVVGDGPEEDALRAEASVLGLVDRIEWVGRLDGDKIADRMAAVDILVLPSHKDGWGAVVNEALMVGTPVICSTACGAAELIREPWLGSVFKKGSIEELAEALEKWVRTGRRKPEERRRIQEWSHCIEGGSVARYFLEIMGHVYEGHARPEAPWRK